VFCNLGLYVIYHIEHPFFERYKVSPKPWPWHKNREEWNALLTNTILIVAVNNLLCIPLAIFLESLYFQHKVPYTTDLESLPTPLVLLVTIPFCILVEDMSNSSTHWLFHRKWLYPFVHKVHHQHVDSIGLASEYAHPIEFMFGNLTAISLGPFILQKHIHLYTVMLWYFIRISETIDVHSGYDFSWSPFRLIPF